VLSAFRALLRDICSRRGVRIAKWLGDGAMLVCVETRPLLETILELHHVVCEVSSPVPEVSIRSGTTSGDVILLEGDDYIGHCVNVASRFCDLAQGGEALVAPSVLEDLPPWGVVTAQQDIDVRGLAKPVPASSIGMARTVDDDRMLDPICGLPLSQATADEYARDQLNRLFLFRSSGCLDTWQRRPRARVTARHSA
jgi:class 3 adenylate cyclase